MDGKKVHKILWKIMMYTGLGAGIFGVIILLDANKAVAQYPGQGIVIGLQKVSGWMLTIGGVGGVLIGARISKRKTSFSMSRYDVSIGL